MYKLLLTLILTLPVCFVKAQNTTVRTPVTDKPTVKTANPIPANNIGNKQTPVQELRQTQTAPSTTVSPAPGSLVNPNSRRLQATKKQAVSRSELSNTSKEKK